MLLGDRDVEVAAGDTACGRSARGRAAWWSGSRGARRRPSPAGRPASRPAAFRRGRRGWTCGEYHARAPGGRCSAEHRGARHRLPATEARQHLMTPQSRTDALHRRAQPPSAATRASSPARRASRCRPARQFGPDGVRGYYIDLRVKAEAPVWPHESLGRLEDRLWVRVHQWGLGAYERYLAGEGEQWLRNAMEVGRYALSQQVARRPARRPVAEPPPLHEDLPAAGRVAVGDGAGRGREPARAALPRDRRRALGRRRAAGGARRCALPSAEGGVQATPGRRRVAGGVPDRPALLRAERRHLRALGPVRRRRRRWATTRRAREFEQGADTLAANLHRWDTGYWSRYDLFPHPVMNVASSFYHALHTSQLEAMQVIAPRPGVRGRPRAAVRPLRASGASTPPRIRAQGAVPARGSAQRADRQADAAPAARGAARNATLSDTIVLCYHAVSERWPAPLSVTPQAFERQLELLVRRGYEGATFRDAVARRAGRQDARGHVRRRVPVGARAGAADPGPARPAGDGVRADRLARARRADARGPASTSGWAASSSPSCAR